MSILSVRGRVVWEKAKEERRKAKERDKSKEMR
jgi:hypothetical protein